MIKKALAAYQAVFSQSEALSTLKALDDNSRLRQVMNEASRHDEMFRALLGPIEELQHAGVFELASRNIDPLQNTLAEIQDRFRLPGFDEAARLARDWEHDTAQSALVSFQKDSPGILRAMEAMRTPWLDIQDPLSSIQGFARDGPLSGQDLPFVAGQPIDC